MVSSNLSVATTKIVSVFRSTSYIIGDQNSPSGATADLPEGQQNDGEKISARSETVGIEYKQNK
jgi:hypothetical protein